jgi:ABC-2 type transport system permease protein
MVLTIALFEVHQRLRRISTYVYFLVFFALSCLFVVMAGGAIPQATVEFGTGGKVLVNSPYALNNIIAYVTFFGVVVTAAIAGQATYQDVHSNSTAFFYTAPITKFQYLAGRFLGALLIQFVIFASVGLGAWVGTRLPWLDPARVGPQNTAAFFQPYLLLVIPNLILTTAIFFGLAALGRKMLPVYAGSVILLIGYFVASQLSNTLTATVRAGLIDPFGSSAIDYITRYWAPFERNTRLIPFQGVLVLNRLLWLGIGALVLAFTYAKFSLSTPLVGRQTKQILADDELTLPAIRPIPVAHPVFSMASSLQQFLSLTRVQFTETVKNVFFSVLILAGALFAIFAANQITSPFSSPLYPVTYSMLELAGGGFAIFALAIITFYSGELAWRERDAQLNQIVDALPVQRWVLFSSKLAALMLLQVVIVLVIMAAGIFVQATHGFYRFQIGLYVKELFGIRLIQYWILCVLALFIHSVINNKYLGHFLMVVYFIVTIAMPSLGLQDYLYRFGQSPPFIYSDINGFGPFAKTLFWFLLYWGIAAIGLAIITNLLWVRGTEANWRVRFKLAAARLSRSSVAGLAACVVLLAIVGGYIFYNTHVLNPYRTTYQVDETRAQYEKKYKPYLSMPQARLTDVNTQIDLDPEKQDALVRGTMTLENKTATTVDRVALTVWPADLRPLPMPHMEVRKLTLAGGQTPIIEDRPLGFYLYKLNSPLPPHGRVNLDFQIHYQNVGFVNSNPHVNLTFNGTFLNDRYLPYIGYAPDIELTEDGTRHRHGLNTLKRLPKLDDLAARNDNSQTTAADWINFEATVSTSPDQIAIMPGYLQKEWTENGRRYFHYKMDAPILDLYSLNSARYAVRREKWKDVNLEVYYQPGHEFDIDHMLHGMKLSLDYCSANFSPFQFHQLRIIEFPRYQMFAESLANTIPFSESIGFLTYVDPQKPDNIDLPLYVTAHETAHQWWGHQVISANVEGQTSIIETLAQYSALMIMKHYYGEQGIRRFLKFELDRYLRGRAQERNEEEPLYKVDTNQGYIHYNKGAVVMYALQDYIGEDKVNQALAAFTKKYQFQGPPYPVSTDLISYLKQVTPPEYQYLYDDLWENITLYDNRTSSATYRKLPDGKYKVHLVIDGRKVRSDGRGQEHEIPIHDWIDIGVRDSAGKFLYLQKQKIDQKHMEFDVTVEGIPARAGIDPLDKLIDRNPEDNVVSVEKK